MSLAYQKEYLVGGKMAGEGEMGGERIQSGGGEEKKVTEYSNSWEGQTRYT